MEGSRDASGANEAASCAADIASEIRREAKEIRRAMNDSVITINDSIVSLSSYADDSSIMVSDMSSDVFTLPNSTADDSKVGVDDSITEAATKSVNDTMDKPIFVFKEKDEKLEEVANKAAKRFEKGIGLKHVRNDRIEINPVRIGIFC